MHILKYIAWWNFRNILAFHNVNLHMKLVMPMRIQLKKTARCSLLITAESPKIWSLLCSIGICIQKWKAGEQEFSDQFLSNPGTPVTFPTFLRKSCWKKHFLTPWLWWRAFSVCQFFYSRWKASTELYETLLYHMKQFYMISYDATLLNWYIYT